MIVLMLFGPFALLLFVTWIIQRRRRQNTDFYGRAKKADAQGNAYKVLARDYARRR